MSVSSSRVKIEFAQASDPGRDPNKQVNEDSCGYAETKFGHLCVLCDGMGGHYGGKEASRLAITTIFEIMERTPTSFTPAQALKAAVEEAGRRVYQLGGPPENRTRPGSTAVAMVLHDRGVDVAHVGDSRAYVIRANQIYPLTRDHSMVQGMIDAGLLTEEQAIGHPDANKITRALGMRPEVDVEVRPEPMELFQGDLLLLASDGLTDLAISADILGATRQALASGDVSHTCNQLVRMANDRGGHDNITVQLARVLDVAPKVGTTIPQAPGGASREGALAMAAQQSRSGAGPTSARGAGPAGETSGERHRGLGETIPMTDAPQTPAAVPARAAGGAGHAGGGAGLQNVQWGPVPPTAPGPTPAPMAPWTGGGAAPTIPENMPVWGSGMYTKPPLAAAAGSPSGAPGVTVMAPAGPTPAMTPPPGPGLGGPALMAATPMPPSISGMSLSDARPSSGGIVFVVIGMGAVIAVLLVLLIWALVLR